MTRVYQLSSGQTVSTFTYNDKGLRHQKTRYALGFAAEDTYYSYDAGGMQVATYTRNLLSTSPSTLLQNRTLYAAGRVGILDASTGKALYELSDHLGNVRAVVSANSSGAAETVSYTDYYPHGGIMPGRTYQSSLTFPYGYQGQEKDAETGLTNFELRQYDPRIGRWYNPDPMGQHHSPYLAMSNNPVSFTDPDGDGMGTIREIRRKQKAQYRFILIKQLVMAFMITLILGGEVLIMVVMIGLITWKGRLIVERICTEEMS